MENSAHATCRALLTQTELTFVTDNLVFAVQQGDPGSFDALIAHMGDLGIYSTEARGICALILLDANTARQISDMITSGSRDSGVEFEPEYDKDGEPLMG